MVARWIVALGLALAGAGCFDPTFPVGLPCGDGCPTGQECQDGLCYPPGHAGADARPGTADAAPDGDPDVDTDGDGVFDDEDLCPDDFDPDQHDEDLDARGDVCDGCPHRADADQADSDGDGVGDDCDPGPEQHRIGFFDPFTTDRPEWTLTGPFVRFADTLDVVAVDARAEVDRPIGEGLVEVGGRITATSTTVPHQITLVVSYEAAADRLLYCEIYDPVPGFFNLTEAQNGAYTTIASSPLPNPLPTGAFRLSGRESVAGADARCRLELPGSTIVSAGDAPIVATSSWSMHLRNISLSLDYAIQFEKVAPPL